MTLVITAALYDGQESDGAAKMNCLHVTMTIIEVLVFFKMIVLQ